MNKFFGDQPNLHDILTSTLCLLESLRLKTTKCFIQVIKFLIKLTLSVIIIFLILFRTDRGKPLH